MRKVPHRFGGHRRADQRAERAHDSSLGAGGDRARRWRPLEEAAQARAARDDREELADPAERRAVHEGDAGGERGIVREKAGRNAWRAGSTRRGNRERVAAMHRARPRP